MATFNLADLWELVADAVPAREALVCGPHRLTYAALDERANRFAHHLLAQGVGPGDHVGLHMRNGTEHVEAMLAAWKIRAVPVNVNYRYVEDELAYLYDNADLVALVVHRDLAPRAAAVLGRASKLRHVVVVEDGTDADAPADAIAYEDAVAAASPGRAFEPRSADDHYILYTGGTTGLPKGVVWRHHDIFVAGMGGGGFGGPPIATPDELLTRLLPEGIASVVACPLIHASGQWGSFSMLFGGGKVVYLAERSADPVTIWRLVERERATTLTIIGDAMARPLLDELERGAYDTSSLVAFASGGTVMSPAVKERALSLLPKVMVIDGFGSSETGAQGNTVSTAGGPVAGDVGLSESETTTVIDDDGHPVAHGSGAVGRLARRGHIPLCYYNDPEKSAATFVEAGGVRWALSGDLATIDDDGRIHVLGRGSLSINTGGEKVHPDEVETALKAHAGVDDVLVVGAPDERWGERVVAVVQPVAGAAPTLEELREHCKTRLAGYKAPRQVVLVDRVVRSPAGKGDYRWAKSVATTLPSGHERAEDA